jgi:hypothetical protein
MEFRIQVIHILRESIGYSEKPFVPHLEWPYEDEDLIVQQVHNIYQLIYKELCEEYGALSLPGTARSDGPCQALRLFLQSATTDEALDAIELTFRMMPGAQQKLYTQGLFRPSLSTSEAIEKLNARFSEHAIGYRFEQGRIIRIDSEFLQTEAVEPALRLMEAKGFEGALEEFMLAHKHYRQGRDHYDDCLTNCGKSLESTLKTICDRRKWGHKASDTASKLLDLVFSKSLIPNYLQTHFSALRATLEGGVPTIRNREGGHGSGERPNEVPEYLAAYQLHLTASAIVFLIRADESLDRRKS